jgi:GR25 family glycosyltransferase involved in LPS biosynthesis
MASTIFISIACFMDNDIVNTIDDCIEKAKYPENLTFGVCLQYDENDNFFEKYENHHQVKLVKMSYKEARGPTYARYHCSQMITNEDFFLQIDCHTRFYENWDEDIINDWVNCKNKNNSNKCILTCFPVGIKNMYKNNRYNVTKSTNVFKNLSLSSIKLGSMAHSSHNKNMITYYLSAAFLFGPLEFIKEVKYDKYLTYSYQTIEQQFYAIRLFTYGWDLYSPTKHVIATKYESTQHYNSNIERVYAPSNKNRGKLSWDRVCYYYGLKTETELDNNIKTDLELYGLGNKRTLNDFFKIHNQGNCIEKLKIGFIYENGKWNKYTYYCKNNSLNSVMDKDIFIKSDIDNNVDFSYNIHINHHNNRFQNYRMDEVAFIDNKKIFFNKIINYKNNIPETFFDVKSLIVKPDTNYFLKYAGNNGGKQVHIYNNIDDIKNHIINDNRPYIIQEEVKNILLIKNKKFVLRNWIVLVDDEFYITTDGVCIIHEKDYDKFNIDRKIHIEHDISKITYEPYNKMYFYDTTFKKLYDLLTDICNNIIKKNLIMRDNCYQILGLDIIFDNKLIPYIIEINSWPNMSVPRGIYKSTRDKLVQEFFTNFYNGIVLKKILNQKINETAYFKKLMINNKLDNDTKINIKNNIIQNSIIINIKSQEDKYKTMCDKLDHFKLQYERFDAINGKDIFDDFKKDNKFLINRYKLRPHQIGVWQSHYSIWKNMVENNINQLLIFEDDCSFVYDFNDKYMKVLDYLQNEPEYDIVFLGYSGANIDTTKDMYLKKNKDCPRCTHAYIITLSGAKKLIDKLAIIDYPIDEIIGRMFYKGTLIGYRTSYLLVFQPWQIKKDKYKLPSYYTDKMLV